MEKKKLIIIDSNSIIHRAYHALPSLTTKKGELVNAIYGFLLVFFRVLKEFQPDYIAATFDFPAPTFRHKKYKEYKAKRPPAPEELYQQIPKVKEVLDTFNVPIFEKEGFEADDIIGTLASRAAKSSITDLLRSKSEGGKEDEVLFDSNFQFSKNLETIILTGDMDTLQLVDKNTKVYLLKKGVKDIILYDENLVKEKFQGLTPEQILDFKALKGDPSDNIAGAKGIGEKTAIKLIKEFGSLENLYKYIENPRQSAFKEKICVNPRVQALLKQNKEQVFLSKDLIQLRKNVPIDFDFEKHPFGEYNKDKVIQLLKNLEFYSLLKRLPAKKEEPLSRNLKLW